MKILVTGGGTGGHIYPALALIDRIKELHKDTEFLYVGTHRGLESKIVPNHGVSFTPIEVEGFKRSLSLKGIQYNVRTVKLFFQAIQKAKRLIDDFKPDIVVGTGGYVSAPVCYAATKRNIPTVIHEQNSVAGITNKFLAKHVSAIAVGFEEAKNQFKGNEHKVHYTGNPRAQEVAGLEKSNILEEYSLNPDEKTVLIFGGSRGAAKINQVVLDSAKELVKKPYQVIFVTGESHYETISKKWNELVNDNHKNMSAVVVPYINQLPEVFASVSLVVSRSGATTLAEITSLGVPSILIPSPNVTEDHQTKNSHSLEKVGAAVSIKESELSSALFIKTLDELLLDDRKRQEMAKQAKALGKQNASDLLIKLMMDFIK
ncbi:undecaprenyldiphospho-muramoylpentapeptide beta-N-acetylglucosaminyltransferase [Alkalibacterium iburiense]|uniref:UDP-N-acetylglucosamine--N-acetylmuramyl-(pentapeptide) pyrophosphoryl-undecaprenol N-acetylglucosamine transferase n=1 Tax=Alkalibacterium iburiense TaxID=290589 RepID=A0ABN0XJN6_9LACT